MDFAVRHSERKADTVSVEPPQGTAYGSYEAAPSFDIMPELMQLSPGDKLGPYEILASIGAGGMGRVYKARDTRLERTVAIKVSAAEFSERFQREAHAIGSLN